MTELQQRARAFLQRPVPAELAPHYVPDSMSDRLLAFYIDRGALDAEGRELAELCAFEAEAAADSHATREAKEYFRECAAILNAIVAEA